MTIDDWLKLISFIGLPGVFMLSVIWGSWKVLNWMRPHAERIIDKHVCLVSTLDECSRKLVDGQNHVADLLAGHGEILHKIHEHVKCDD